MNNQAPKAKKIKVKILKNCVPSDTDAVKGFLDNLGRLPKGAIVEMSEIEARSLVKIKAASMDAAV
jgi:hypothetical protein